MNGRTFRVWRNTWRTLEQHKLETELRKFTPLANEDVPTHPKELEKSLLPQSRCTRLWRAQRTDHTSRLNPLRTLQKVSNKCMRIARSPSHLLFWEAIGAYIVKQLLMRESLEDAPMGWLCVEDLNLLCQSKEDGEHQFPMVRWSALFLQSL